MTMLVNVLTLFCICLTASGTITANHSAQLPFQFHPFFTNSNNSKWSGYIETIQKHWTNAGQEVKSNQSVKKCGEIYNFVLQNDLSVWKDKGGITYQEFIASKPLGVHYQIIDHVLYREPKCIFGPRCKGVEHFILNIIDRLPNMEMIINVYDWPKVNKHQSPLPVFSFSKTSHYWDILYPAWTFWSGGPALSIEPKGLGRWDMKRISMKESGQQWPWKDKKPVAFFRGSRTSSERDSLVLLSREKPQLVDASYTKNQAWKSAKDTLNMEPAKEIKLEDHCCYKYLFNFRGVAASFRFKHLFLCRSLVLHVDSEWVEFFYPAMKPWVHYVPVSSDSDSIQDMIEFVSKYDEIAQSIADRGFEFIWNYLTQEDVQCYWEKLLLQYSLLMTWEISEQPDFINVT